MVVVVAAVDLLGDDEMGMTTLLARQLGQADLSLIVVSGYSDCQAIEMWCRGMYHTTMRSVPSICTQVSYYYGMLVARGIHVIAWMEPFAVVSELRIPSAEANPAQYYGERSIRYGSTP